MTAWSRAARPDVFTSDSTTSSQLIGQGEVSCINDWKVTKPNILVMDGDPTDNNATLFAQGYNGVLTQYLDATYVKVGEPAATWTPSVAQATLAQQRTALVLLAAVAIDAVARRGIARA